MEIINFLSMNKIYLYGASGHAKVIIDILKASKQEIGGLFDDNPNINTLSRYKVYHNKRDNIPLIISIGNNKIRKTIAENINCQFKTAIHPSAIISESASIDVGTVVMQGTIIQAETKIGKHCIINTGASIDHECIIEDYAHISPHATLCGNVSIGEGTWIGAGSTVIQGVKIGKWCVIGAGSVVTNDIPDNVLAVGNRCKIIKEIR